MDKKGFYTFPPVDTPLKGAENYAAWALSMQYNLKAFGVWGYVQGKIKCPSESSSSSTSTGDTASTTFTDRLTAAKWSSTDDQIQAYIMRSVVDSIRMHIGRLTSSGDQWS